MVLCCGGWRWQRVPPTERNDRVHTSTITVAVIKDHCTNNGVVVVRDEDIVEVFTKGSGAGGQKRNKTCSAVVLTHKPSGMSVRSETERSQKQNRQTAKKLLVERLSQQQKMVSKHLSSKERKDQVGSGMRGDKSFTVQVKHNRVVCHTTGKQIPYSEFRKGKLLKTLL